ncbi:hypothetical protein C3B79_0463 [Aeromonas hydrophila]|nr:hypothetical protein C3B79_0463 [Aeromonas hydrophila]
MAAPETSLMDDVMGIPLSLLFCIFSCKHWICADVIGIKAKE